MDEDEADEDDADSEDVDDNASFADVDDLDGECECYSSAGPLLKHVADEGEAHLIELSKLAEKDPEFYKYLQENDKELLDFDPDAIEVDEAQDLSEDEQAPEIAPVLTKETLRKWQKVLLEV